MCGAGPPGLAADLQEAAWTAALPVRTSPVAMPKKRRSKSPTKVLASSRSTAKAEAKHFALWESLAGRVPPFKTPSVIEANHLSPRNISPVSARLAHQAAQYEAGAHFLVAADKYQRSAKFRMAEQKKQSIAAALESKYLDEQAKYRGWQEQVKQEEKAQLAEYSRQVRLDAEVRREKEIALMRQRERNAAERLKVQAQQAREEEEAERLKQQLELAAQAKLLDARLRKKADEERRLREAAVQLMGERSRERAALKEYEEAKERANAEHIAEQRRAKRDAWALEAKLAAEEKARVDADVKAKFKASEAERLRRAAEAAAEEKRVTREKEAAFRRKQEEEKRAEREALRERERANRQATKEALASMYQEDEHGRLVKIADPMIEAMKRARQLEAEAEAEFQELLKEQAAKAAAFEAAKKADAARRQKLVEEAQREIAATFKANKEKELADQLAREAAEKARFRQIALETREKIEAENAAQREAERQAALTLKAMKAAQLEAEKAKHASQTRMAELNASNERRLQVAAWEDVMARQLAEAEAEAFALAESKKEFALQHSHRSPRSPRSSPLPSTVEGAGRQPSVGPDALEA